MSLGARFMLGLAAAFIIVLGLFLRERRQSRKLKALARETAQRNVAELAASAQRTAGIFAQPKGSKNDIIGRL